LYTEDLCGLEEVKLSSQVRLFPQRIQNMSFIFIVVLRTWKSLTPKDVTAVKGLKKVLTGDDFIPFAR
jgi:hypothetical protein